VAEELKDKIQAALEEAFAQQMVMLRQQLAERLARESARAQEIASAQAAAEAGRAARESATAALSAAVRRLRRAADFTEIGGALLETAASYCGRAVLFIHEDEILAGWRAGGFSADGFAEGLARLRVPLAEAPAFARAIQNREMVTTPSLPREISPALAELLGSVGGQPACLFPLCLRDRVAGILYADSVGVDGVQPAALELLCAVAESSIETLAGRTPAGDIDGQPVRVARPATPPPPREASDLSSVERDFHLRAQRFARVLVADLQLYRAAEIRDGKRKRDLYGTLRQEIDRSREAYGRKFPSAQTAGVDYFHQELVHSLAGDDEPALGPDYPGSC